MSKLIEYVRPKIYEYQKKMLDSPARFTVCEAATKVGKTASHIIWLFEQPLDLKLKPGQKCYWISPVYSQAEVAYQRMKAQVTNSNFFKSNESKLRLIYPTGAEIHFKSASDPDTLYGDDVYAFVFDEFTRAKEAAWFALRSTITATKAKGKFIGNCKGQRNWGHTLAMKAKAGEKDYEYFKITAYDAAKEGLLSLEEIESAKRDLPESVFRELYLAEASEDGSNPFGLQHIPHCVYPISKHPPVCFGIDLAKSHDWTVIIGLDKYGFVSYFDRFQKGWPETVSTIKNLPDLPMKIDSTGVGDPIVEYVQKERSRVEGVKFTQASKQQLMEGLALAIQQRKIAFPEGPIKDELESFEFEYTKTGVKYTAPYGLHDDCVCALALANDQYKTAVNSGKYCWV